VTEIQGTAAEETAETVAEFWGAASDTTRRVVRFGVLLEDGRELVGEETFVRTWQQATHDLIGFWKHQQSGAATVVYTADAVHVGPASRIVSFFIRKADRG
jgi:hypothetical protein